MNNSIKKQFGFILLGLVLFPVLGHGRGAASSDEGLQKVRVGVHANEGGIPLAAVGKDQGFFRKYGIEPVFTIVESGPSEMVAMRADNRTLDIGFIGAGVAWNPIDGAGNSLSFVFLDNVSSSEMLLAQKGIFVDSDGNGKFSNAEIYAGLKGKTVFIEVGTTPGGWFKTLLELVNEGKDDSNKLWLSSETAAYMAGYSAPNANSANKVMVVNTLNTNLPAGMASNGNMDIVAGFSPATTTILRTNKSVEIIATTVNNFPPEASFPSTWVASDVWLDQNPELAQNFVNALYESAIWRHKNIDAAMRSGEKLAQKPTNSFDSNNIVDPSKANYQSWFQDRDSLGYAYMKSLYDSRVPNVPQGNPVKTFEQSFKDDYMLNAIRNLQ